MSDQQIKVSVLCLAYNHEKYIRQTLEGFVCQKTDFAYEVIIHDDASTDQTAQIIPEYAEKYPELIIPIFQTENQYFKVASIWGSFVNKLIRGEYIALCEGDDFWTDCHKLQKQYDAMKRHPECSMCVHRIEETLEDGTPNGRYRPSAPGEEGMLDTQQFLNIREKYPFQTASYFARAQLWFDMIDHPAPFAKVVPVGDEPMLLYMAAHGKLYYLPDCMSVYRTHSVGSWSAANKTGSKKRLERAKWAYEMMRLFDEYTHRAYDCRLDYYKAHILWVGEDYRQLVKKEHRAYVKRMSLPKRVFVYVSAALPFVGKIRKLVNKKR